MKHKQLCIAVLMVAFIASFSFATPSKATARRVIGDVNRYNAKKSAWSNLRVQQPIFARDSITTALESDLIMSLPDGSSLTIRENSKVVLDEFYEENGAYKTNVNVIAGRLDFSVQKQNGNSSFNFKTGIMAAAIRGTEGCFAGGSTFLAGLKNGALQVDKSNIQTVLIHGGQIVFDRDSLIVMDLESAGEPEFHDELVKVLENKSISTEDLKVKIKEMDIIYTKSVKEARSKVQCTIDALPDTISNQEIQIHGHCTQGATVSFFGEPIVLETNGNFFASLPLDSVAVGEKRMKLTCSALNRNFDCAEARTYYKPEDKKIQSQAIISSKIPAQVCEDGLSVEGTYQTLDSAATLILSVGNSYKSANLIKTTDGKSHPFAQNITVTDRNGLWDAKIARLELDADGKKTSREIPLQIKRSCQSVNQLPPQVQVISYDSLVCAAYVTIGGMQGDMGIFRTNIDNVEGKASILEKNTSSKIKLKSGIHEYEFLARDQAGNESSITKTMGCFPDKYFSIQIKGNTSKETTWLPPGNPSNYSPTASRIAKKTLRFKINLSDVSEIYSVIVKHNGIKIVNETLAQIESLDYDVPLELVRGKTHKLEVIVKHKSGHVATATKIYEVK